MLAKVVSLKGGQFPGAGGWLLARALPEPGPRGSAWGGATAESPRLWGCGAEEEPAVTSGLH